jgi:hypothetical protein
VRRLPRPHDPSQRWPPPSRPPAGLPARCWVDASRRWWTIGSGEDLTGGATLGPRSFARDVGARVASVASSSAVAPALSVRDAAPRVIAAGLVACLLGYGSSRVSGLLAESVTLPVGTAVFVVGVGLSARSPREYGWLGTVAHRQPGRAGAASCRHEHRRGALSPTRRRRGDFIWGGARHGQCGAPGQREDCEADARP